MDFLLLVVGLLLLHCQLTSAGFCSDSELAGTCFEDRIAPMAIAATVVAFLFGITVVLVTTALLCKAKRRRRAKVMVYRKPYEKKRPHYGPTHENAGFESGTQYYVKRPSDNRMPAAYVEPSYVVARNGTRPAKDDLRDIDDSLELFAGDGKRPDSRKSSELVWLPGNGNTKKLRAEVNGNGSYY